VGHRFVTRFELLLNSNNEADPMQRMLNVVKWLLACTLKEKLDKKPYNPLLGEHHLCWNTTAEHGQTKYMAEQVSHHPPVSGINIWNEKENVEMLCNLIFSVKFHGNSVSVKTDTSPLHVNFHNLGEQYLTNMPNVSIKNVILGTKRIAWDGPCVIRCEKTGLQCHLKFKEEGWNCYNTVTANISKISDPDAPLYTLSGHLGETISITNTATNLTEVFLDVPALPAVQTQYPEPEEMSERNSLKIWHEVTKAIVDDDMNTADTEKVHIENAQRARRNENQNWEPRYFKYNQQRELWEGDQEALRAVNVSWDKTAFNAVQPVVDGEAVTPATSSTTTAVEPKSESVKA